MVKRHKAGKAAERSRSKQASKGGWTGTPTSEAAAFVDAALLSLFTGKPSAPVLKSIKTSSSTSPPADDTAGSRAREARRRLRKKPSASSTKKPRRTGR